MIEVIEMIIFYHYLNSLIVLIRSLLLKRKNIVTNKQLWLVDIGTILDVKLKLEILLIQEEDAIKIGKVIILDINN